MIATPEFVKFMKGEMNPLKQKHFKEFVEKMEARLEKGDEKYGNDWYFTDLPKEMEEELLDLANYAYLLYRKVQLYREETKRI